MRESLKAGDRVLTSGGIYGKLKEINDTNFIVEIAENVRVKVDKASVFAATNESSASK
jgi:preprotein translocase subunit YajC